jgi:hypothetical protein
MWLASDPSSRYLNNLGQKVAAVAQAISFPALSNSLISASHRAAGNAFLGVATATASRPGGAVEHRFLGTSGDLTSTTCRHMVTAN